MSNHEREFINNFLTLACLEEPALPNDYSKPLEELNHLGLSLQPLDYKFDNKRVKLSTAAPEEDEVELTLKSIRAPKFTLTKVFAGTDLVLQVKDYLRKTECALDDKSEIKLLLKGKVLNDGTILSDLNSSKAILTVMISQGGRSAPGSTASSETTTSLTDANPSQKTQSPQVSASELQEEKNIGSAAPKDMPWEEINALLKAHFSDLSVSEAALNRLKRGWELAK